MELLGISDSDQLSLSHRSWVEEALKIREKIRERRWSESVAVRSLSFIEEVKAELGTRGFGRNIISSAEYLYQSTHIPREDLCMPCFDGNYPVPIDQFFHKLCFDEQYGVTS